MTNSSNVRYPQTIDITHNGTSRRVPYQRDVQHSITGSTRRQRHCLEQTSPTTTFLRQLELFCGESLTDRGISNDRKIQSIARGIARLEGVSCNFDEMVVQQFHKDGRELFLESIDFDKGHLWVVEIQNDPFNSLYHSGRRRTIEELWRLAVQDTAASAPTVESMMDDINNNNGFESDLSNEEMLQNMRKIIHRLEEIEERLQDLLNHSDGEDSGRTREVLVEYTQYLTYLNKKINEISVDKGKIIHGIDREELDNIKALLDSEDEDKVMDALKRLMYICKSPEMEKLRKWLRRKIPLNPVVLLFDDSNSMVKERSKTLNFCKQFIETLKNSPKITVIAVCTVGGGPRCLIPFTLAQDFNVNHLDQIQYRGCTPLTASVRFARRTLLIYIGDDENRRAMSGYIVMVTDLIPTEEWNGGFTEYYSNPKDENQESRGKFQNLVSELKGTIKELKDIPLVVVITDRAQLEIADDLLDASEKGYVVDISSTNSFHPIQANSNLHQIYQLNKGSTNIDEQLQSGVMKKTSKIIIQDNKTLAEILDILDREWVIDMESETIGLTVADNYEINRRAMRQGFQNRSIVVDLLIKGKRRNCRIFSNHKTTISFPINGSPSYERKNTDESYKIRITFDDGNIETYELVQKQHLKKKTKANKNR